MFLKVARFEVRYQIRNPILWIAVLLFAALVFAATIGPNSIGVPQRVQKNTPFKVAQLYMALSVLYMFVSAAFVANAVVRDQETGFAPILRTTPISKSPYLLGRYAGALFAAALSFLAVPVTLWLGTQMPWADPALFEPNRLAAYLLPFLLFALPNLFVASALFFALAVMTRSMVATYVGVIALLMFWGGATVASQSGGHKLLTAYIDPLGLAALAQATRYWSPDELNTLGTPVQGVVLWNRIIWIAIGTAFLALAHARFQFTERVPRGARRRRIEAKQVGTAAIASKGGGKDIPRIEPHFGHATAWAQLRVRTQLDMVQIFRSPAYLVLLVLGLIFSVAGLRDLDPAWGTPSLPVTRLMIQLLDDNFKLIPLVIAIYYSGELVWHERDRNIHEIIGTTAIPDWAYVVPKVLSLALVLISTLLVSMIGAVTIQLFGGYTQLELDHYLLWYLLPNAVDYVLIAILAVFVQAISPHKIVGWGFMLIFVVSRSALPVLGLQDHLYTYAQGPVVPLSDMNGQGRFWIGAWSFRAYWAALALLILVLSHALWRRGAETLLKVRLKRVPHRLAGPAGGISAAAIIAFVGLGVWCFINTHVWNAYRSSRDDDRYLSGLERQLLPYARTPQPTITMVRVNAELWPHQQKLVSNGTLDLVNRQTVPLTEVHLRMRSRDTNWTALDVAGATLAKDYPAFQYRIYRFATPLAPGAVTRVTFTTVHHQIGFRNEGNDVGVVDNGTFVDNFELLPTIGMDRHGLIEDHDTRRRYALPVLSPAGVGDISQTRYNRLRSDWVKTDIILTTDADQTPIAPGTKIADGIINGRRTARFITDVPILNFFSLQSARYKARHILHKGVDLAVYYDARHSRNIDRMLTGSAHALDLYRSAFGPYQFRHARIVEFPAYRRGAQSFAGTFPYSEGLGFIADFRDKTMLDYVGRVVAHESAHQWWGHQAIPADMQGASLLDETLAQYSALMVMQRTGGRDQVRRYLRHELDTYLSTRGFETAEELPLSRVGNQPYVYYQKGELAMYRLRNVLGNERVNAALRRYLYRFGSHPARYPRSLDLIAEFRKNASLAENELITDLFEKITLYDIRTTAAKVRKLPDSRYETILTVEAHKYHADGKGKETETPLAERMNFSLLAARPGAGPFAAQDVLSTQSIAIRVGVQQIRLITSVKPSYAGTDPFDVLIDRNSDDNVIATTG
ncbi:M1 family aminopeptidase [Sphingomonas sp. R86521]|uniref:ABC transporter permease/M1 family aminopeptidase n=1 Tax=Sphingomonas sp. R86521 TaxID=3093860 RepID=UPI0036D407DD